MTVLSAPAVVLEPSTKLFGDRNTVALRGARARTSLLLSKNFAAENAVRGYLREEGVVVGEVSGGGGPGYALNSVNKRTKLVELVRSGAVESLRPLEITPEEARALGVAEGTSPYDILHPSTGIPVGGVAPSPQEKRATAGAAGVLEGVRDYVELGEGGVLRSSGSGVRFLATLRITAPVYPDATMLI